VITTLTLKQNVLFLRQLHQYLLIDPFQLLPLARHLRPELFLLRLLLLRLCRLARDQNPTTRCLCTAIRLMLAPRLRRRLWQSEAVHLQCPCCVIRQHLPRRHNRRGHPTLEAKIAHRMQHLSTGDLAGFLQFLVACLSSRQGHHRHHHRRFLLLQAGKVPTCREHRPRIMTSAAKVNMRATTTPTLHLVSNTRTH
jgi:hypothetical protein